MPDVKERILGCIDPGEVIELARSLVRIPSYTTDESDVARFLRGPSILCASGQQRFSGHTFVTCGPNVGTVLLCDETQLRQRGHRNTCTRCFLVDSGQDAVCGDYRAHPKTECH